MGFHKQNTSITQIIYSNCLHLNHSFTIRPYHKNVSRNASEQTIDCIIISCTVPAFLTEAKAMRTTGDFLLATVSGSHPPHKIVRRFAINVIWGTLSRNGVQRGAGQKREMNQRMIASANCTEAAGTVRNRAVLVFFVVLGRGGRRNIRVNSVRNVKVLL